MMKAVKDLPKLRLIFRVCLRQSLFLCVRRQSLRILYTKEYFHGAKMKLLMMKRTCLTWRASFLVAERRTTDVLGGSCSHLKAMGSKRARDNVPLRELMNSVDCSAIFDFSSFLET